MAVFPAGPQPRGSHGSVPRRTSTASFGGQRSPPDLNRKSEDMPDRTPERMSEDTQKQCQKIRQKECQKICQIECQNDCQKRCQKKCQKICPKECQKICQRECQKKICLQGVLPDLNSTPDRSGHSRTPTASARSQWAPAFNCGRSISARATGPQPQALDRSGQSRTSTASAIDRSGHHRP